MTIFSVLLKDGGSIIPMGMIESIKSLFRNRNYIFLFLAFNFLYGLQSAIAGVISSFTEPYHYKSSDISIICMVFMLAGIFNSFFIGVLLDKYQCYKKAHMCVCIGSIVALALSAIGLPSGKTLVEAAIMMITGAAIIPNVPISFSLAAEVSHPVPESYSIGIMLCSA